MPNEIEIRFESKGYYDVVQKNSHPNPQYESVSAYLSLRKPKSPLSTIELDEDSFELAYPGCSWSTFVDYALGAYASRNTDKTATVYTYSTGPRPSVNFSRGEQHRKLGWHNAVFFGVVGRAEVLETIRLALAGGSGVPDDMIQSNTVDSSKRSQVYCGQSPDYIAFDRMGQVSCHVEDGMVWRPYEQNVWYSHSEWRQLP